MVDFEENFVIQIHFCLMCESYLNTSNLVVITGQPNCRSQKQFVCLCIYMRANTQCVCFVQNYISWKTNCYMVNRIFFKLLTFAFCHLDFSRPSTFYIFSIETTIAKFSLAGGEPVNDGTHKSPFDSWGQQGLQNLKNEHSKKKNLKKIS